jgi:hypothetical protein
VYDTASFAFTANATLFAPDNVTQWEPLLRRSLSRKTELPESELEIRNIIFPCQISPPLRIRQAARKQPFVPVHVEVAMR